MVMNQVSLTRRTRKNNAISAYSSANGGLKNTKLYKNQMDESNFMDITNISSVSRNDGLRNETSADSNKNEASKYNQNPKLESKTKPNLTIAVLESNFNLQELILSSKSKKMNKNNSK
jgi:hypothetical protein